MNDLVQERRWFWITLILSSTTIVSLVFAFWELIENRFFRDLDYVSLHYLYITRGITASILLATWAGWFVTRQKRVADEQLRKSHARYRGLLEASPGAVVLYDRNLKVLEWNASAERLFGWTRAEVIGLRLPTVPENGEHELGEWLNEVHRSRTALDRETTRKNQGGELIEVQLSLLPYHEAESLYFLEVTADIRERVRLRQRLIELEKLTSMGQMAAGTAHHLNTPLASMLLRVQMMRDRVEAQNGLAEDLKHIEHTIGFCQQFVRRLLDFSRRPSVLPEPQRIGPLLNSAISFVSPSVQAKRVKLTSRTAGLDELKVLADPNNLETLLLILLSNALDAVSEEGNINITLTSLHSGKIDIIITDDGMGISEEDQKRLFEPFFTTKPIGKGTGLGLAIAKNIASEYGGEICLDSTPGLGTKAVVVLPIYSMPVSATQAQVVTQ